MRIFLDNRKRFKYLFGTIFIPQARGPKILRIKIKRQAIEKILHSYILETECLCITTNFKITTA